MAGKWAKANGALVWMPVLGCLESLMPPLLLLLLLLLKRKRRIVVVVAVQLLTAAAIDNAVWNND